MLTSVQNPWTVEASPSQALCMSPQFIKNSLHLSSLMSQNLSLNSSSSSSTCFYSRQSIFFRIRSEFQMQPLSIPLPGSARRRKFLSCHPCNRRMSPMRSRQRQLQPKPAKWKIWTLFRTFASLSDVVNVRLKRIYRKSELMNQTRR